ncbi:MAG: glycosyltransferase family 39 protein, partial [Bryobacteraceae bacterium]|nr:glycosyltransferase family 39 protein [Bryobacteraceae bacterium]
MITAGRVFRANLCLIPVFLLAVAVLGIGIERASIAAPFSDPIRQLRAQDESIHVSSSMAMLHGGDWGTPTVMGRPLLFKPPLLQWLTALSLKALGPRLLAVRLPALLFGALAAVLLFQWGRREASLAAGAAAALLLVSNPLWQTFSRLCYTDIPAAFGSVLALFSFGSDSALKRRRTLA